MLTHRQFNARVNSLVNAFCRDHLAGFKKPKSVEFQEELPKSPAGKILKESCARATGARREAGPK